MNFTNYYEILGLQRTATQDEIKLAYRKLSLKFHPDQNQGDQFLAEMFKKINEANEILSNPEKRKNYDLSFSSSNSSSYQSTNSNYSPRINSAKIKDLTNIYFEKQKTANLQQRLFQIAESQPKPKNMTASKILGTLFIFLVTYFLFKPNFSAKQIADETYLWRTTKNSEIYIKPDIKSEVIGSLASNEVVNEIEQTKYFIKFEFTDNNGVNKIGYIRKLNVEKN
ncbi:MAG: J domain-containing protein [Bacteroidetes bacterium]|jgi:curved DNA-binding protein CbpA|nr:J domain-containing protein [Bacteroidota bacterium]